RKTGGETDDCRENVTHRARTHLELELRHCRTAQWLDDGVEQAFGVEAGGTGSRNTTGSHDRLCSHHHDHATPDAQLVLEGVGNGRYRTCQKDCVVLGCTPTCMGVADFNLDVVDLAAPEVVGAEGRDAAVDFNAGYLLSQACKQCRSEERRGGKEGRAGVW